MNMSHTKIVLLIVLGLCFETPLLGQGQDPWSAEAEFSRTFGKPLFLYDLHTFKSTIAGKFQTRIYLVFVNDILQFVKQEDSFRARYEIAVDIFDFQGRHRAGKIHTNDVFAETYEETNSREIVTEKQFGFDLAPGLHDLVLEITDLETKRKLKRKRSFEVKGFASGAIDISDVVFVDRPITNPAARRELSPVLNQTFEGPHTHFAAYFEVYNHSEDSVALAVRVRDSRDSVIFAVSEIASGLSFARYIPLREHLALAGPYYFEVEAEANGRRISASEFFLSQYSVASTPAATTVLSGDHLQALKFITDSEEFGAIMEADETSRRELIRNFWQQRDPTPVTQPNELSSEFSRRVGFTTRHFSVPHKNKTGWRTDRGKTYIIFGSPSEIRRRSADLDSNPYEIWYYRAIDRRFVFLDKTGFGDYKLVHKD